MVRKRPTASEVVPPPVPRTTQRPDAGLELTRAEARALSRGAPLTPAQFKWLRRLAEQGVNPLRHR